MNEKKKMNFVHKWLQKAESDIKVSRTLLEVEDSQTDAICFHCQQAIEKYFKAYLTFKNIRVKKIHDLEVLLDMCIEKDKDFENLDRDKISDLSYFAVEVRYPDEFYIPSIEEARDCLEIATKIREFILQKLG
ncbi:MAG TPA: DNA-binding protein [Candidatus Atribacteria bacterium]|nr:DNA-binding protein [Candidatus Atribacteria bacterium]